MPQVLLQFMTQQHCPLVFLNGFSAGETSIALYIPSRYTSTDAAERISECVWHSLQWVGAPFVTFKAGGEKILEIR